MPKISEIVAKCCCDNYYKFSDFKIKHIYSHIVVEVRSPKMGSYKANKLKMLVRLGSSWRLYRRTCPSQGSLAMVHLLVTASLQPLLLSSYLLWLTHLPPS